MAQRKYTQRIKFSQYENFLVYFYCTTCKLQKPLLTINSFNIQYILTISTKINFLYYGYSVYISHRGQNQNSQKCQYLVCLPLAWMTAKQCRLILFISRLMTRKGLSAIILHVHFEYLTHTFTKNPIVLKHVHQLEAFTLGFRYKRLITCIFKHTFQVMLNNDC